MLPLRFGTVCSGIDAPSAAWRGLGWQPTFFSEIDPHACAVLSHHYPDVPNLGNMEQWRRWPKLPIDLLMAGTPCQAFSVAGKRGSLEDERGNLTLTFCHIADYLDPEGIIWENVPGVLNTEDNAFGCFLGELCGEDAALVPPRGRWTDAGVVAGPKRTIAWRVIDAQGFIPQRRARVFVVAARTGGRFHPADVLFETEADAVGCLMERLYTGPLFPVREGVPGHPSASGGAGQDIAGSLTASSGGSDENDGANGRLIPEIAHALKAEGHDASEDGTGRGVPLIPDMSPCITGNYGKQPDNSDTNAGPMLIPEVSPAMKARDYKGVSSDGDGDGLPLIPCVSNTIGANSGRSHVEETYLPHEPIAFAQNQREEVRQMDVAGSIAAEPGMKQQTYIAFSCKDHGADAGDVAPTMRAMPHDKSHANAGGQVAVAHSVCLGSDPIYNRETAMPQTTRKGDPGVIQKGMAVRRLMPVECERLFDFPDGYTEVPYNGKVMKDGPRYRLLGNSIVKSVLVWIGERVEAVW